MILFFPLIGAVLHFCGVPKFEDSYAVLQVAGVLVTLWYIVHFGNLLIGNHTDYDRVIRQELKKEVEMGVVGNKEEYISILVTYLEFCNRHTNTYRKVAELAHTLEKLQENPRYSEAEKMYLTKELPKECLDILIAHQRLEEKLQDEMEKQIETYIEAKQEELRRLFIEPQKGKEKEVFQGVMQKAMEKKREHIYI